MGASVSRESSGSAKSQAGNRSSTPPAEVDLEELNRSSAGSIYSPLKPGFIRTVTITPSEERWGPVECALEQALLANPPEYKSLSYAWGSKSNPGTITLNKMSFMVTDNLLIALMHLRAKGLYGPLWIDALSINQGDIKERDSQVQEMRTIYANAVEVLQWLGPHYKKSQLAMRILREGEAQNFSIQWMKTILQDDTYGDHFGALINLFFRSYWMRLWIVQEIAFAKGVLILCGGRHIYYSSLLEFVEALKAPELEEDIAKTIWARHLRYILSAYGPAIILSPGSARSGEHQDPVTLLARYAVTKRCRDPRDKIYGFFGLFDPELRQQIRVDYSKSSVEVFKATARAIIQTTRRLEVVCVQRRVKGSGPGIWEQKLPSWVPPWSGLREGFDVSHALFPSMGLSDFTASGSREAHCCFLDYDSVLKATGLLIGRVTKIYLRTLDPGAWGYGKEKDHIDLLKYTIDCRRRLGALIESRERLVIFWSTLLFGITERISLPYFLQSAGARSEEDQTMIDNRFDLILPLLTELEEMETLAEWRTGIFRFFYFPFQIFRNSSTTMFDHVQVSLLEALFTVLKNRVLYSFQRADRFVSAQYDPDQSSASSLDIGVAPDTAEEGDYVCVLLGCKVPVILRPVGHKFKVIGDAYVNGFMNGEALNGVGDGFEGMQDFLIE